MLVVISALIASATLFLAPRTIPNKLSLGGLPLCTVTESVKTVGHQESLTVANAGSRQWLIIQQPVNATNTVALSTVGAASIGSGFEMTEATTSSPVTEFAIGFSTDYPTSNAVTAISGTGSTTVKVLECK